MSKVVIKIHVFGLAEDKELNQMIESQDIKIVSKVGLGGVEDLLTIFMVELVKKAAAKTIDKIGVLTDQLFQYFKRKDNLKDVIVTIEHEGDILFKKKIEIKSLPDLPQIILKELSEKELDD